MYEDIVETVREPLIVLDSDLRVLSANRSFYETFRVMPGETIGNLIYDLGNRQWDIPGLRTLLEEILPKNNKFADYEVDHIFSDVGHKIMLLNARRIIHHEKGPQMILLAIEDITERKRKESLLEASEAKYRELVQNVNSIILKIDPEGKVTFFNKFAQMFFDYTEKEILGRSVVGTIVPESDSAGLDLDFMIKDIAINPEKYINNENENMRRNGERIWVAWTNRARERNGKIIEILCIGNDITERRRMDNELKDYEERFRELFSTAKDGLLLIDKQTGNIVNVNPAIVEMLGYFSEEFIGKKLKDIGLLKDMKDFKETIRELNQAGFINYENVFAETKLGQLIDVDIYLVDRARFAQCNVRSITERKKLSAQLRQAQKMEAVGLLAGGLSHDFNNILTAIVGYGHLLKMKMKEDDPLRHNVTHILDAVERGSKLIQSLLAFSRKQVMNPMPASFNTIVECVYKLLKRLIGEDIELKTLLTSEDVTVMADCGQIEQVLMNLAANARDAMPDGGRLTIETERAELSEEYVTNHGFGVPGVYALLSVTDTGTGMDEETKTKIFEPFFTTKEVDKGTGLGLSVIYGIIKQHKGYINVYSEPGEGTTFKIYLPVIKAIIEEMKQDEIAPVSGGNETVLIAEDDEAARGFTKTVLQEFGYTVIEAKDGEEALSVFSENSAGIKLIVTDMIMPKMHGNEVYEKARIIRPDIKCLFMSGYSDDIIQKRGILKEGVNFISKPFSPYDLLRKVRVALDQLK